MKKNIKFAIIILIITVFSSCLSMKIEQLTMQRMDNTTTKLKLNGYYFDNFGDNDEKVDIIFFYKNGVLLDGMNSSLSDLEATEADFKSGIYADLSANNVTSWGVYKINKNTITTEQWFAGNRCCKTLIRSGTILNDTTFQFNNEVFKFKAFSPKPDSTNVFID